MNKIKTFRDLVAWQKAHQLVLVVYEMTARFPRAELFGLASQMRRCAISVVSNIAEGFARKGEKEKVQFYFHAKSSLVELQSQVEIAKDLGFISARGYMKIESLIVEIHKVVSGLIKSRKH